MSKVTRQGIFGKVFTVDNGEGAAVGHPSDEGGDLCVELQKECTRCYCETVGSKLTRRGP
jgi:hypothetical protein